MRTFECYPQDGGQVCPICGENRDEECTLVRVFGTTDGNIAEAAIVHTKCLHDYLVYYPDQKVIASMADHYYRNDEVESA